MSKALAWRCDQFTAKRTTGESEQTERGERKKKEKGLGYEVKRNKTTNRRNNNKSGKGSKKQAG